MSRIRSIKPQIWESEDFQDLSPHGQLIFIWLFSHADDDGRLRASGRHVARSLHLEPEATDQQLKMMIDRRMIQAYYAEGAAYISVCNFKGHQVIHKTHYRPSTLPAPPNPEVYGTSTVELPYQSGIETGPPPQEGKGREGKGVERSGVEPPISPPPGAVEVPEPGFQEFISELNRATSRSFRGDQESKKLYRRALERGRTPDELLAAARGVAQSEHHMGRNDRGLPFNGPVNVLRSKVLDQLIAAGRGEISLVPATTNGAGRQSHYDAVQADYQRLIDEAADQEQP